MNNQEKFCYLPSGVSLCYSTYGNPHNDALLLIAGLGQQLHAWPTKLIELLVAQDLFVIVFDNRDTGRSSRIDEKPPSIIQQFLKKPSKYGYSLEDMAKDAIGLLDYLQIKTVHIVGMSMGGMIAQIIAVNFPEYISSLTSIFSTTGDLKVGQPTLRSMFLMVKPQVKTKAQAILRFKKMMQEFGPRSYKICEQELENYAALAWDRGNGKADGHAMARQISAILRSGDRTESLKTIKTETLIIHADHDVLVNLCGGTACHRAIKNSKMVIIRDLGHYLPKVLLSELSKLIGDHIKHKLSQHTKGICIKDISTEITQ